MIKGIIYLYLSVVLMGLSICGMKCISWTLLPFLLMGVGLYCYSCYKIGVGD